MSTINLNPKGSYEWALETRPDFEGELQLCVDGDEGDRSVWLDMAMLLTLREMFGSIASKCLCMFVAEKAICEEYDRYTLTVTHPECPFHGEKD